MSCPLDCHLNRGIFRKICKLESHAMYHILLITSEGLEVSESQYSAYARLDTASKTELEGRGLYEPCLHP
jgi:hypothetical protein